MPQQWVRTFTVCWRKCGNTAWGEKDSEADLGKPHCWFSGILTFGYCRTTCGRTGEARTGKRNHTFNERNVVILGKIGTGKRTLANRTVGADIFQPSEHSDSEHSDSEQHYEEKRTQNMLYRILIVHTGSLQTDLLTQYIRRCFERIHLIILQVLLVTIMHRSLNPRKS